MSILLEIRGVAKSFFGVSVLQDINLSLAAGRVLGVVGENGAGKSTLMNILGGDLRPDAGTMVYRGFGYAPSNPHEARLAGVAFVHQELNLFPNLSIGENLFLATFPMRGPCIDRAAVRDRTRELLLRVGLDRAPSELVENLPAGERQLVELARALSADARLIILDEPTTSLGACECERLFALVRQMRAEGRSIIYISHALEDVLRLCDDVLVLRDGRIVGQGSADGFTTRTLVSLMVGRELTQFFPVRAAWALPGPVTREPVPLFEARGVSRAGVVRDVSFRVGRGEVLGISGLMGAGRTELARMLFGLDPCDAGTVLASGRPIAGPPRGRIRAGLAFVTENRRHDGLCLEASVSENMALVALPGHRRGVFGLLDFAGLRAALAAAREAVRLQPRVSGEQPVKTLSGGNQQKVVLAKWLLARPEVLILDEPTRGIDVGARFEIYTLIHALADRGTAVIMISSDMDELMGTCDRMLVMSQGAITADLPRPMFERERILQAALPR